MLSVLFSGHYSLFFFCSFNWKTKQKLCESIFFSGEILGTGLAPGGIMSHQYPLNSLPPNGYMLPPGYSQVTLFNPSQNYTRSTENLLAVASMIPQTLVNLNNSNLTTSVNSTFTTSSGYNSSQLANSSVPVPRRFLSFFLIQVNTN